MTIQKCSPAEDKAFGEIAREMLRTGLTMHVPKKGSAFYRRKEGKRHPAIRDTYMLRRG